MTSWGHKIGFKWPDKEVASAVQTPPLSNAPDHDRFKKKEGRITIDWRFYCTMPSCEDAAVEDVRF